MSISAKDQFASPRRATERKPRGIRRNPASRLQFLGRQYVGLEFRGLGAAVDAIDTTTTTPGVAPKIGADIFDPTEIAEGEASRFEGHGPGGPCWASPTCRRPQGVPGRASPRPRARSAACS